MALLEYFRQSWTNRESFPYIMNIVGTAKVFPWNVLSYAVLYRDHTYIYSHKWLLILSRAGTYTNVHEYIYVEVEIVTLETMCMCCLPVLL